MFCHRHSNTKHRSAVEAPAHCWGRLAQSLSSAIPSHGCSSDDPAVFQPQPALLRHQRWGQGSSCRPSSCHQAASEPHALLSLATGASSLLNHLETSHWLGGPRAASAGSDPAENASCAGPRAPQRRAGPVRCSLGSAAHAPLGRAFLPPLLPLLPPAYGRKAACLQQLLQLNRLIITLTCGWKKERHEQQQ